MLALLLAGHVERAAALDLERPVAGFHHTGWTVRDGAPGQVTALAQTRDGYLWLGTQVGLFRHDGVRFERYQPRRGEPLVSEGISALLALPDGGLWVGYRYGGASLLRDDAAESYVEHEGFSTGSVFAFAHQRDGTAWVATYQGLMRFDGARWRWQRADDGFPARIARTVMVDRDDTVWVASDDALYARTRDAATFARVVDGLARPAQLAQGSDGTVWIAESEGMVRALQRDATGRLRAVPRLARAAVAITFDRDGGLWIATPGDGVRRLVSPSVPDEAPDVAPPEDPAQAFTQRDGLTADFVGPVLEDREGTLWFGTARGLDRFRHAQFVTAALPAGASDFAIAGGDDGALWIGTRNRPLMRLVDDRVDVLAFAEPVSHLMRDRDGRLWFGGAGGIGHITRGVPTRTIALPEAARDSAVQAMALDGDDALWVSLNVPGVFRWRDGAWTHVVDQPGLLPRASPLTLLADRDGRLWMGFSRNRLTVREGDRMRLMGAADGLDVGNVTAIAQGRDRTWIAGEHGLQWFDGERFRAIVPAGESPLRGVSGLVETGEGDLWLHGSRGVVRITARDVGQAVRDPAHRVATERFDFLDGLPGVPAQFRPLPTVATDARGRLWFATTSGVAALDPARIRYSALPPPVRIVALDADDREGPADDGMTLPADLANLRVRYTALSLAMPERVRFRYRLDGFDRAWHDAGTRREANYTNLDPGDYRFHVQAANEAGVWNEVGATLDFSVAPAWHETTTFRVAVAAAIVASLWLLSLLRARQIGERIRARVEERRRERERIARELHDTLLQSVQGLILRFQVAADAAGDEHTRRTLEAALDRADQVVAEGRDRVNELRAPADATADLPSAFVAVGEELLDEHACQFDVRVDGEMRELLPLVREEVHRIGSEALVNAFRHARATRIAVTLQCGRRAFVLRVADDGRGIDPAIIAAGSRGGHWGLVGMRERTRRIGGVLDIASAPGAGTTLVLRVPAAAAYVPTRTRWWPW